MLLYGNMHNQLAHLNYTSTDTSVEFQRVNSQICVAMMVFAPIYVAQMISSYLRDPKNKTGAFGWGYKRKATNYEKYDTKTKKMAVAPPGE